MPRRSALVVSRECRAWVAMSYPPEPVASARRCTVTGRNNGGPCSIVAEELPDLTTVVLYPHGINSYGVVLDRKEQEVLGQWLLSRHRTPKLATRQGEAPRT